MGNPEEALKQMFPTLVEKLLEKIDDGSATAADLSVARHLLKDNGIDISSKARGAGNLHRLSDAMPFQDPETNVAANQ